MLAVIDETLFGTGCAFELATSVGVAQRNIQRGFSRGTGGARHAHAAADERAQHGEKRALGFSIGRCTCLSRRHRRSG